MHYFSQPFQAHWFNYSNKEELPLVHKEQ